VEAPSGERLRCKTRHGVLCRLKTLWSMPERFKVVCTMQGAIQVLWFTFLLSTLDLTTIRALSFICEMSAGYILPNNVSTSLSFTVFRRQHFVADFFLQMFSLPAKQCSLRFCAAVLATLQFHCNFIVIMCRMSSATRVYCDKMTASKITRFYLESSQMSQLLSSLVWRRNSKGRSQ